MKYLIVILLALGCAVLAQGQQGSHKRGTTLMRSDSVTVTGVVEHPFTITLKDLAGLTVQQGRDFKMYNHRGEVKDEWMSFRGVLLKDIVGKAEVKMPDKREKGKFYVRVTGTDGYEVLFSFTELFYGAAGQATFLMFEANGKLLDEEGPFATYCTSDLVVGPRHVRWVKSIVVGKVD